MSETMTPDYTQHWRSLKTLPTDGTICIIFYGDLSGGYLVRYDEDHGEWLEYRGTYQLWFPLGEESVGCGIGWIPFPDPDALDALERAAEAEIKARGKS